MKKFLAITAFVCSCSAVVSFDAQADQDGDSRIYHALPGYGQPIDYNGPKTTQKSIGGLRCRMFETAFGMSGVTHYIDFECKLSKSGRDDSAIYVALNVSPSREATTSRDEIVEVKSAGKLKCWKKTPTTGAGNIVYGCKLPRRWLF